MVTKAVLLTAATLTAVALAGCQGTPDTSTGAAPATPASAAPAESASSPAATPATSATRTSDPGDGPGEAGGGPGDAGDGGNWFAALAACPNEGQKAEVQRLELADVTGDGVKDALVARTCEASTSYLPSTVEVFDGTTADDARPRRIETLLADVGRTDLPWFRSMAVRGGTVTIKAYGVAEGGTQACPELEISYVYRFAGGAFARTGRTATTAADCLRVG